jgi:hypothetical protein
MAVTRTQGAGSQLARGQFDLGEPADRVAALHAITVDPKLLGLAAGPLMLNEWRRPAVELLKAVGADLAVAGEPAQWIR